MYLSRESKRPPEITSVDGEILQEILGTQVGDVPSHSLPEVTIPPGKSSTLHYHQHAEESYFITAGEARLVVDQVPYALSPGDAVLIQPPEVHQIFNQDSADLVFIAVCIPAWRPDDSYNIHEIEAG